MARDKCLRISYYMILYYKKSIEKVLYASLRFQPILGRASGLYAEFIINPYVTLWGGKYHQSTIRGL